MDIEFKNIIEPPVSEENFDKGFTRVIVYIFKTPNEDYADYRDIRVSVMFSEHAEIKFYELLRKWDIQLLNKNKEEVFRIKLHRVLFEYIMNKLKSEYKENGKVKKHSYIELDSQDISESLFSYIKLSDIEIRGKYSLI